MRKDKLYLLTFLSVTIIYVVVALIASRFFLRESSMAMVTTQLELGKKEAKTFASLVGSQLNGGLPKDTVIANVQEGLGGTTLQPIFLSVLDWSGRIISHPEIKQVGQKIESTRSSVSSVADNLTPEDFHDRLIHPDTDLGNDGRSDERLDEVIFMEPVANSDWIVASHVNLKELTDRMDKLKGRFYTFFSIIGLIIIPAFVITTRFIGSRYEERLELQRQKLETEVINLAKLNRAVGDYQQKVSTETVPSSTKKRILTHLRNELLSVPIKDIAHIHTENTVTYVMSSDGKRSTTNASLDELYSQLDETTFFRANRQFIIAISSIQKIVKYGNNQLKILVTPDPNSDILISKNRAAEFKNWLNL